MTWPSADRDLLMLDASFSRSPLWGTPPTGPVAAPQKKRTPPTRPVAAPRQELTGRLNIPCHANGVLKLERARAILNV
eukprot:4751257-Pyramimonas_sp.AAC.1